MSGDSVMISVERATCDEVREVLRVRFDLSWAEDRSSRVLGLSIVLLALADEHAYARHFLSERGLVDANPIWRAISSEGFDTDVHISAPRTTPGHPLKEALADIFARALSEDLMTRVAVSIQNGEIPFGLYEHGRKTVEYAEHYAEIFSDREWLPRVLSNLSLAQKET